VIRLDVEIIKKLIALKDERMAAFSAEAQGLNAQLRDLLPKVDEVKHRLVAIEAARSEVVHERAMLFQAIGGQTLRMPSSADFNQNAKSGFVVEIRSDNSQGSIPLDLSTVDLSDGEPKVRQHTTEVRKHAVLVTLRTGPRSTSELIKEFETLGFRVAEENEVANLSAILSRTSFFKSENRKWHLDITKLLSAP
jgi:hypothetical protein